MHQHLNTVKDNLLQQISDLNEAYKNNKIETRLFGGEDTITVVESNQKKAYQDKLNDILNSFRILHELNKLIEGRE